MIQATGNSRHRCKIANTPPTSTKSSANEPKRIQNPAGTKLPVVMPVGGVALAGSRGGWIGGSGVVGAAAPVGEAPADSETGLAIGAGAVAVASGAAGVTFVAFVAAAA